MKVKMEIDPQPRAPVETVHVKNGTSSIPPTFEIHCQWEIHRKRLDQYFIANQIEPGRQVAILLTTISDEVFNVLRSLCNSDNPLSKTYAELVEILQEWYISRRSVFRNRIKFYKLFQSKRDSINIWYLKIKNAAIPCEFGDSLDSILRDKFITGLRKGPILECLCEEDHTKTIYQLLDIALEKEANMNEMALVSDFNKSDANDGCSFDMKSSQFYKNFIDCEMYVQVSESENSDPIDMPTEDDDSLLLSTLEAQYPGAIGLKYRVNNRLRIVRLSEGKLYAPEDGWLDRVYMCNFRNTSAVKRKHNEIEDSNKTKDDDDDDDDSVSDMDLVVLGLPWKITEEDLKKYFSKFGQVEYTQIKTDPNGKSKGYGFVRFKHKKSQVRVMLERHNIEGRWCDVRIPNSKDKHVHKVPRKVFIGQVSEDVDEDALRNYFIKFGEISDLFLPRPHRGFAFVTFTDPSSAQKVIGKDHKIGNCSVVCTEAIPKKEMAPKWNDNDSRDKFRDRRRDRSPHHPQAWAQDDIWDYDQDNFDRSYSRGSGHQSANSFTSDKNLNTDMVAAVVNKAVMNVFGNLKGQGNQNDKLSGSDDWWMRR